MNAAAPSWRVATTRMPAPSNASSRPRNDSPGTVKAYRTPAARRASATNRPTVRGPASDDRLEVVPGPRRVGGAGRREAAASGGARRRRARSAVATASSGVGIGLGASPTGSAVAGSGTRAAAVSGGLAGLRRSSLDGVARRARARRRVRRAGVGRRRPRWIGSVSGAASSSVMTTVLLRSVGPRAERRSAVVLELERDGLVELAQPGDDALEVVRLLPDTRTASPWICDLTFGNSSRISLVIFLAISSDRPRRSPIRWRTLLPPASSTLPQSKILSDRLRRIAFDSMRSLTAAARYSSSVTRMSSSLAWVRSTVTPLKSNRCADLAPDLVERVAQLLLVEVAHDVE